MLRYQRPLQITPNEVTRSMARTGRQRRRRAAAAITGSSR